MNVSRQGGFVLIELVIALTIIGIMLRITLPSYQRMLRNARAAQVIGDFNVIRAATFAYNAETNTWPKEYATGKSPTELTPYLPAGYAFKKARYQMDWENWILPSGLPKNPATKVLLGISVNTTDKALGNTVVSLLGKTAASYTIGNSYTFLILSTANGAP